MHGKPPSQAVKSWLIHLMLWLHSVEDPAKEKRTAHLDQEG
jgi:hypothetical protein